MKKTFLSTGKPLRYNILGDEKELDMDPLEKLGAIKRLAAGDFCLYTILTKKTTH